MISAHFHRFACWLDRLMTWVSVICLAAMALDIALQVCARELFEASVLWTEDVGRILMIWGCLAGATCAFRAREDMPVVGRTAVAGLAGTVMGWIAGVAVATVVISLLVSAPGFIERSFASYYDVLVLPRAVSAIALPVFAAVVGIHLLDRMLQGLQSGLSRVRTTHTTKETQDEIPEA